MSSFTLDAPEELTTSNKLDVSGKFHAIVKHVEVNPVLGDKMVRGFRAEIEILAPKEHAEKTCNLLFANGDMSHKDKGEFARTKQTAFCIATNLIDFTALGKSTEIDLDNAANQHVCIEIEQKADRNDPNKHFPELRYSNIYHVDDPRAKSYPRDENALKLTGATRRPVEYFDAVAKKKPGSGNGSGSSANKVTDDDLAGL